MVLITETNMRTITSKALQITLALTTSVTLCTSYAAKNNNSAQLNTIIKTLASQEKTNLKLKFQPDQALSNNLSNQVETQQTKKSAQKIYGAAATQSVANNLSLIRDSVIPTDDNTKEKTIADYTSKIPAGDTPYIKNDGPNSSIINAISQKAGANSSTYITAIKMPDKSKMQNQSMNFSYIFNPTSKNPNYKEYATNYINYISSPLSFKNSIVSGIDFSKLQAQIKSAAESHNLNTKNKAGTELASILLSPNFLAYQLKVRHLLAIRSMATSNLNQLISERTPVKITSIQNGSKVEKTLSPLDVEKSTQTHRITDPNWYKAVQAASPASIQRRTLVILAEIEAQNYQAHIDRERLIALESTSLLLQSNQANSTLSQTKNTLQKTINNTIKS